MKLALLSLGAILLGAPSALANTYARFPASGAASGANSDITGLSAIAFASDPTKGISFRDSGGTNYVQISAPSSVSSSYTLFWPPANCGPNQPLVNDGTGQLTCGTATTSFDTIAARNTALANIGSKQIPALVCATNVALTGDGTCDGVLLSLLTYPVVLAVAQTDNTENGIWCTAAGAWQRCGNMPDNTYTASGALVTVATGGGTTYDNTVWYVSGIGDGALNIYQIPVSTRIARPNNGMGTCTISSTTVSTTASNLTCTGVPASTSVAVTCTGAAAFTTTTADGIYCRATGVADQVACNTFLANAVAMSYACMWMKP